MTYCFGSFRLDLDRGALMGPEGPVPLRPQAFRVLTVLVTGAPRIMSRKQLLAAAWDVKHVSPSAVKQVISELRAALGDDAASPRYIETVHRRGYRMVIAIDREDGGEGPPRGAIDVATGDARLKTGVLPLAVWIGLAVVVGAVAAAVIVRSLSPPSSPLDLGRTQRLTHDQGAETYPTLSPDGAMVAYVGGPPDRRDLFVQDVTTGTARRITARLGFATIDWPQWSVDGRSLLFATTGVRTELQVARVYEGSIHTLLEVPGPYTCGVWSPDGQAVAYVREDAIWIRPLAPGAADRQLVELAEPHSLAWSPDGAWIAAVSGNRSFQSFANNAPAVIWLVAADGHLSLPVSDSGSTSVSPSWAPGGRSLLYLSNRDGALDLFRVEVSRSGRTSQPVRITTGLGATSASLSRSGTTLVYSLAFRLANVWTVPVPTTAMPTAARPQPVTRGSQVIESLDVSRDGRWLVYDSNVAGNQEIFKQELPGGEPIRLTDEPADDFGPSWSPDGREIAFYSLRSGSRDIYVMDATGRSVRQVTSSASQERYPDWSPDGNSLVFDCTDDATIQIVSRPAKGRPWGAVRRLATAGSLARAARWSPVGDLVACPTADSLRTLATVDGSITTLVELEHPMVPLPWAAAWSTDGRVLYYKLHDAGQRTTIWSIPAAGGTPELLVTIASPSSRPVGPDFATDGTRFYFTLAETEADVWLVDLE